uniref:2-C-methyl-D-erythritol 4-phosphate cytidylyltransferase n=1 Tax=candidate division WOR-3 bacterium TaxID=2052148 RepID=A0A7V3RHD3_UNCW3
MILVWRMIKNISIIYDTKKFISVKENFKLLTFSCFWLYFFMKVYAVIVGAGRGKRFGGLKQFIIFQGRPLLIYTTEIFEKSELVDSIIIVVPKEMLRKTKKLLNFYCLKKVDEVIPGGERRQDSVYNGIKAIKDDNGVVIIHDAVRPFISQNLINKGINLCKKYKAVIFGMPIFDTIKLVKGNKVIQTIPRVSPFAVQTPQFFNIKLIKEAYDKVDFKKEFTDEASILESLGIPVYIFKGDPENIKITTKQDLKFFKTSI